MTSLNYDFPILSNCFCKNFMVLNPNNVPLFYLTLRMKFKQIENSKEEKVLGITFDNKLEFTTHLTSITKKANTKLNALNRVQIT